MPKTVPRERGPENVPRATCPFSTQAGGHARTYARLYAARSPQPAATIANGPIAINRPLSIEGNSG